MALGSETDKDFTRSFTTCTLHILLICTILVVVVCGGAHEFRAGSDSFPLVNSSSFVVRYTSIRAT